MQPGWKTLLKPGGGSCAENRPDPSTAQAPVWAPPPHCPPGSEQGLQALPIQAQNEDLRARVSTQPQTWDPDTITPPHAWWGTGTHCSGYPTPRVPSRNSLPLLASHLSPTTYHILEPVRDFSKRKISSAVRLPWDTTHIIHSFTCIHEDTHNTKAHAHTYTQTRSKYTHIHILQTFSHTCNTDTCS